MSSLSELLSAQEELRRQADTIDVQILAACMNLVPSDRGVPGDMRLVEDGSVLVEFRFEQGGWLPIRIEKVTLG